MEEDSTRVLLVRHGETENAYKRCYNGHFDIPLSKRGVFQIEEVRNSLSGYSIDAVYSSDLERSYVSASIIAEKFSLPVEKRSELREICFGRWEGIPYEEIKERYPQEMNARFKDISGFRIKGGGENIFDLTERVIPAFKKIVSNHINKTILLALHGGVNKTILGYALNMQEQYFYRISQKFAAINIITYYKKDNTYTVELVNG